MTAAVLELADCDGAPTEQIGGKALGLGRLIALSLDVPPGFVVTTDAFSEWMRAGGLDEQVQRLLSTATDAAATRVAACAVGTLFASQPLQSAVLDAAYGRLTGGTDEPVAVRSSATAEDSEASSYAGQQETFLWVRGAAEVRRRIVECWASLFSAEAVEYRRHLGIAPEQGAMAVVVQRMVPAEAAGVMFTVDPVTADPSQITIESTIGLGMPLVGGELTPDRYCVDKVTLELRSRTIAAKPFADRFDHALGETRRVPLSAEEGSASSLTDAEVKQLAAIGKRLEHATGSAMDVEWAFASGDPEPPSRPIAPGHPADPGHQQGRHLYLLQARPQSGRRAQDAQTPAGRRPAVEQMISGLRRSRAIRQGE